MDVSKGAMHVDPAYTVSDVARRAHVTVRTLHHYDSIGLLRPSGRTDGGYRLYDDRDVERLAAIVALRAAGMSLADIPVALDAEGAERAALLDEQVRRLDAQIDLLQRQRQALMAAREASTMGIHLNQDEIFDVFGDDDPRQFDVEVAERWGETDAYRESRRRTSTYSKDDWARAKADQEAVAVAFLDCMHAGHPADGPEATAAAEAHRQNICTWYYDCTYEMQARLADMYLADPRFRAYYDDRVPGLAQYVHDAIVANALAR